jgi:hypothetical protein
VHVAVDETGQDTQAPGLDHLHVQRGAHVTTDLDDATVDGEDVVVLEVGPGVDVQHVPTADQDGSVVHGFLQCVRCHASRGSRARSARGAAFRIEFSS